MAVESFFYFSDLLIQYLVTKIENPISFIGSEIGLDFYVIRFYILGFLGLIILVLCLGLSLNSKPIIIESPESRKKRYYNALNKQKRLVTCHNCKKNWVLRITDFSVATKEDGTLSGGDNKMYVYNCNFCGSFSGITTSLPHVPGLTDYSLFGRKPGINKKIVHTTVDDAILFISGINELNNKRIEKENVTVYLPKEKSVSVHKIFSLRPM